MSQDNQDALASVEDERPEAEHEMPTASPADEDSPAQDAYDERSLLQWNADDKLPYISEMIVALVDLEDEVSNEDAGVRFTLEEAKLDLPVELAVEVDECGVMLLSASPPTQHTETSVLPVFHRLRLRVVRDNDE